MGNPIRKLYIHFIMKIKKLNLYTNELELEFYSKTLGFDVVDEKENSYSVKVGGSKLTFTRSEVSMNIII
jgi:catechol-2,3-dioxygenase